MEMSEIPNAGCGAFLTFLGARHLKSKAYSKLIPKSASKVLVLDDLQAVSHQGFGINVRIAGEMVDGKRASRPKGIGPDFAYDEADYEASPTTVFSSEGNGNGMIQYV